MRRACPGGVGADRRGRTRSGVGEAPPGHELFVDWVRALERKGRAPSTIHGYQTTHKVSIQPYLGRLVVRKVTTKHLTDLYGALHARGLKSATGYQVHATLSSMFTQACKWGWRDANPAQWADPPSRPSVAPVIEAARTSRRPEYARAIFIAATTGVRRGELCAIRVGRDIDVEARSLTVRRSIVDLPNRPVGEQPTKNRRVRPVALDEFTLAMIDAQHEMLERRAAQAGESLVEEPFLFSDAIDGSELWRPSMVTRYFARLRERAGFGELDFHSLREFMSAYGQDLGVSGAQVALRAGHDPSVAARHYTGRIAETDRALALAVASLLAKAER
jgi:integrase